MLFWLCSQGFIMLYFPRLSLILKTIFYEIFCPVDSVWSNKQQCNKLNLAFIHIKNMASFLTGWLASVCNICRSVHVHCVCAYGPVGLQRHWHECRACNPINQRRQIKLPRAAKKMYLYKRSHNNMKKKTEEKSPSCVEYIYLHIRTMNDQKEKWLCMQKWKNIVVYQNVYGCFFN